MVWLGVWIAIVWEIWIQRNKVVFNNDVVNAVEIFTLAQLKGWLWAKFKKGEVNFSLAEWMISPLKCLQ